MTAVYDVLKSDMNGASKRALIAEYDSVLSLSLLEPIAEAAPAANDELAAWVEAKITERAEAKKAKNYALADAIRAELTEKGIVLKDSKEGTTWTLA